MVKWVPALWGWWGSGQMGSSAVGVVGYWSDGFQRCCGGGGVVVRWVPALLWGWWGSGQMGSSAVGVVG